MQQNLKTIKPLQWLAVIMLASTMFIACNDTETKTTETTVTKDVTKDSLPPLNKDADASTRPETIKNK